MSIESDGLSHVTLKTHRATPVDFKDNWIMIDPKIHKQLDRIEMMLREITGRNDED